MANLAIHLNRRYDRTRDPADLEASVSFARAGARATSPLKRKDTARRWGTFGQFIFERYQATGNDADLHTAIGALQKAAANSRAGTPERITWLTNLSVSLHTRYELTQSQADLDQAAAAAEEAVARLPADPGYRAPCLNALAHVRLAQAERSGQLADLDRAVRIQREAVACWPADDPGRAVYAAELATSLVRLFETNGSPAVLDEAQAIIARAVALTGEDSSARPMILAIQCMVRWRVYEQTGLPASLDAAKTEAEEALAGLPAGHFLRQQVLATSGMIELRRYERTGDRSVLDGAIVALRQAVDTSGSRHYLRPGWLSMFGSCLGRRFERTGSAADLDDAIDLLREGATTSTVYNYIPLWLNNLCIYLKFRFRRAGDGRDIDEAVEAARRAVDMADPHVPHRALVLSNLGSCLLDRHNSRFSQASDLDDALDAMREAVQTSKPEHGAHPVCLMNLGVAYVARFDRSGALTDAREAVRYCREALTALPEDFGERGLYLSNLSVCLDTLAKETGNRADAAEALNIAREALADVAPDHPERARYLRSEGDALQTRYGLDGDLADLRAAFGSWRAAVDVTAFHPVNRLETARQWGRTAAREGMMADAVEGFSAAVKILPEVVWHGLNQVIRQQQAARWAGLAADAACCAVRAGQPELAVELLEQGRSMLWSQALNLRADLGGLPLELASRLEATRAILNAPPLSLRPEQLGVSLPLTSPGGVPVTGFHPPRQEDPRTRAARDHDETIDRIRQLDGFERYLEPTPYPELAAATSGGAAVIVNASEYGCHAIIVTSDSEHAQVVDLPGLGLNTAAQRADHMSRLLRNLNSGHRPLPRREADRRELLDILGWLWDVIGSPVLDSLASLADLPRIWWCPTGPLVSLPLHAAGHYPRLRTGRDDGESVLARTISSYIPTLTSLRRAREFAPPERVRQLTIATPDVLPHVSAELAFLNRHFPPGQVNHELVGPAATRAAAAAGLADHDWIHLACHARPLDSDDGTINRGFVLSDGDLTITDLAAQPGRHGGLAFLSACQTAAGSDEHLDEALHLAAAMQFIGYSHVVATMWSIEDASAPLASEAFYTALSRTGHDSADALRTAIMRFRAETDPTNPFIWAPYAHYGY